MDSYDDPEEMTPEARLAEVASILAAGYLRLCRRDSAASTENPLDCPDPPMAVCDNGIDPEEHAA